MQTAKGAHLSDKHSWAAACSGVKGGGGGGGGGGVKGGQQADVD
jgi:hypothetical protein